MVHHWRFFSSELIWPVILKTIKSHSAPSGWITPSSRVKVSHSLRLLLPNSMFSSEIICTRLGQAFDLSGTWKCIRKIDINFRVSFKALERLQQLGNSSLLTLRIFWVSIKIFGLICALIELTSLIVTRNLWSKSIIFSLF